MTLRDRSHLIPAAQGTNLSPMATSTNRPGLKSPVGVSTPVNQLMERRHTHTLRRRRHYIKTTSLVHLRERRPRVTTTHDRWHRLIRPPVLSSPRGWLPQNNRLPSTSANTAERVSLALAASRFMFTATQGSVHSNAPLRDAIARLACRATCVATRAPICRRETRRPARAKATKRARRVPPNHDRGPNRRRRLSLDERHWNEPGRPRGGSSRCRPTLIRTFPSTIGSSDWWTKLTTSTTTA